MLSRTIDWHWISIDWLIDWFDHLVAFIQDRIHRQTFEDGRQGIGRDSKPSYAGTATVVRSCSSTGTIIFWKFYWFFTNTDLYFNHSFHIRSQWWWFRMPVLEVMSRNSVRKRCNRSRKSFATWCCPEFCHKKRVPDVIDLSNIIDEYYSYIWHTRWLLNAGLLISEFPISFLSEHDQNCQAGQGSYGGRHSDQQRTYGCFWSRTGKYEIGCWFKIVHHKSFFSFFSCQKKISKTFWSEWILNCRVVKRKSITIVVVWIWTRTKIK